MELKQQLHRNFPFTFDPAHKTITVTATTDQPVYRVGSNRKGYIEVLEISNDAIDFTRLNDGAPFLKNHKTDDLTDVIGVVERAWVEGNQLAASVRFSNRDDVANIVKDVEDGILRNISIGYDVYEEKEIGKQGDIPILQATRWTPYEISAVPIGADASSHFRSLETTEQQTIIKEGKEMEKEIETKTEEVRALPQINPDEVIHAERSRIGEITKLCRSANLTSDFAEKLIGDGASIEIARSLILDEVIKNQPKVSNTTSLKDAGENFRSGVEAAVLIRAGKEKDDTKNEYRGMSLMRMAEEALMISGQSCRGASQLEIAKRALHSTSDFPLALSNVVNKTLQKAYEVAPEVYPAICRVISVVDFKQISSIGGGEFSELDEIVEGAEYKYGTLGESQETFAITTFGKLFQLTRKVLINDDLNFLTATPTKMGRAAARKVGDLVWRVLTANANMSDGNALFSSAHSNISTGAITIAAVNAAKLLMNGQKDITSQQVLNIRPVNLIVPTALELTAKTLMAAVNDPDATSKIKPNIFANAYSVIADARLDQSSAAQWYLQADPNIEDSIVLGYLNGQSAPYLEQQVGFEVDGISYKVRIDAAAKAVGWKGLVRSSGV
ncbi:MAG: prohead protease/major capsid protein fusion protein [Candidatus Competibacter sp.]|jgi:phage major head subunit gpT-like protein